MNARRFPLARAFLPGTHSGLLRTGLRYTRIEFHLDGHQTYPLDTPRLPAVCPTWRRRRGLPSCCGTFRPLGVADGSLSWSSGVETTAILFHMSSGRDCGDYGRAPRVPFSGEANLERVSPRWFQELQRRNVAEARKRAVMNRLEQGRAGRNLTGIRQAQKRRSRYNNEEKSTPVVCFLRNC